MERKIIKCEVKQVDETKGIIEGYGATFSKIPDSYNDIIEPGAFSKTLRENGDSVVSLFNHDPNEPIGKPTAMQDEKGLHTKIQLVLEIQKARDVLALAKAGVIKKMSIGYDAVKVDFVNGVRHIKEIRLYDISPVIFAANPEAVIMSVKKEEKVGVGQPADAERDESGRWAGGGGGGTGSSGESSRRGHDEGVRKEVSYGKGPEGGLHDLSKRAKDEGFQLEFRGKTPDGKGDWMNASEVIMPGPTPGGIGEGEGVDYTPFPSQEEMNRAYDLAVDTCGPYVQISKVGDFSVSIHWRSGEANRVLPWKKSRLAYEMELKPYPNEHACRLCEPGDFQKDSFRRVKRDSDGKAYSVIMGKLEGEDTMTEQAYRYNVDVWDEKTARSHCGEHDGSFEAASKEGKYGRMLSASSTEKVRAAVEALQALLKVAEDGEPEPRFTLTPEEATKGAAQLEAALKRLELLVDKGFDTKEAESKLDGILAKLNMKEDKNATDDGRTSQ